MRKYKIQETVNTLKKQKDFKMLKKLVAVCTLLLASNAAQAALIEYNGYSRDTANNYVSSGTMDWLAWDQTTGMTIETALNANAGWSLATESDVSTLFSSFAFGGTNSWATGTNVSTPWAAGYDTGYEHFVDMFGTTLFNIESNTYLDPSKSSNAIFGSVADNNLFNANVGTDSKFWYTRRSYEVTWGAGANLNNCVNCSPATYSNGNQGIALVRNNATEVSEPATIAIFALSLCGLAARRKKLKGKN